MFKYAPDQIFVSDLYSITCWWHTAVRCRTMFGTSTHCGALRKWYWISQTGLCGVQVHICDNRLDLHGGHVWWRMGQEHKLVGSSSPVRFRNPNRVNMKRKLRWVSAAEVRRNLVVVMMLVEENKRVMFHVHLSSRRGMEWLMPLLEEAQ